MSTVKAPPIDATPLLKRLATRLSGTATFPTVSTDRLAKYTMVNAALFGLSTGQPVKVEGAAGFGKTSFIKQICELAGYDVAAIHVPLFTPKVPVCRCLWTRLTRMEPPPSTSSSCCGKASPNRVGR